MRWQDEGIILSKKFLGENYLLLEVFCKEKGRVIAGVKGIRSSKKKSLLQLGNYVYLSYSSRSKDSLGYFSIEPITYFSGEVMQCSVSLYYLQLVVFYLRYLPEYQPYDVLYSIVLSSLSFLRDGLSLGELLVRFEVKLLQELGFGLSLDRCALTGETKNLYYISPKTGAAVTKESGEPWADKLFVLPQFLLDFTLRPKNIQELIQTFDLTGHFLERYLQQNHSMLLPDLRNKLICFLLK